MARILVTTTPDDVHAAAVTCALERRGHQVVTLYGPDLPTALAASVRVGPDSEPALALDDIAVDGIDSVWLRRPARPVLPDDMHPADRTVAGRELDDFVRGFYDVLAPRALWVNPIDSHRRGNSKLSQLREAQAVGLTIPDTLVSNDPARIRGFVRHHGGEVIYKPLRPSLWTGPAGRVSPLATLINEDLLPDDDILRLVPGIFQPRIAKRHELRSTFIGHHVVTARIRSQDAEATRIDWRGAGGRAPLEPDTLPAVVEARCREVMRRLGIVFGCVDLIVTPDGDHVFLEVNESGQWLWVEEALPETALLDRFVAMLAQGRADFAWSGADRLSFDGIKADAVAHVRRARAGHVAASTEHIVVESDDPPPSPPASREALFPQPVEIRP
jgi:hypothetical protein